MKSLKQVLFITYHFPPIASSGVQRPLKFIKYLPEFGWQPVVITSTPNAYPIHDESLWLDVPPNTPVYRVNSYEVDAVRPFFDRLRLGKLVSALKLALIPDSAVFWSYLSRATVKAAVKANQPDVIFSTSGPGSAHLLAQWAKKTFGLPWFADFRDPWSQNPLAPFYPGYRSINRYLERKVLTSADAVIAISEPLACSLEQLANDSQCRTLVIENGFDEDDVEKLPLQQTEKFTITYTGRFTPKRRPDAVVTAIQNLIRDGTIDPAHFQVLIAGPDTKRYTPDGPPFEHLGYLNHHQLKDVRVKSNLLLQIQSDDPGFMYAHSGKLFEYLGSNRPTLSITHPQNAAAALIESANAGTTVHHNPAEIAHAILYYYNKWQTGDSDYHPNWEVISQYTRRNLSAKLAREFDNLILPDSKSGNA